MNWVTRIFLLQAVPLFLAAIPLNASETECTLKVPTEYTEEDPTDGEIADVFIEIGVPVNRGYRRYNRGYYRSRYPFHYIDDPYYYYGPGYYQYYGRYYDDDDDDCRGHRRHRRRHSHDCDDD